MSILVSILLSLIGFVCLNFSLFLHNLYFISISNFMCHAYFIVSEKNSGKVCVCMHFTMHTIFMCIGTCFSLALNVLFHECNGWQGYQMIKNILI